MKTTVTLLILFTLLLPSTFAQDYMRWELPEGATTRLGKGSIREIQYAPDGRTLASGAEDATVRLWDPVTGELKRTLTGHSNVVSNVAFSPDGQTLASGAGDGTVGLWDVVTGE